MEGFKCVTPESQLANPCSVQFFLGNEQLSFPKTNFPLWAEFN